MIDSNPYSAEAAQRWPNQFEASEQRLSKLNAQERQVLFDRGEQIAAELAQRLRSGDSASDASVQDLIAQHFDWVCNFWTPNATAYRGLGQMYVTDSRFTAYYDGFATGLAAFLNLAMAQFADTRLAD
ncbi:MAG: TipAS antibiotic-recognition domain-containing protein [Micrococcales bacterium]